MDLILGYVCPLGLTLIGLRAKTIHLYSVFINYIQRVFVDYLFIRHPPVLQPVGTLFLCIFVVDGRSPEIRIPSLKAGYFERVSKLDKQESSLMEIYNDAKTVFALNADPRQCYFEDLNLPLQSESWVFIDVLTVA